MSVLVLVLLVLVAPAVLSLVWFVLVVPVLVAQELRKPKADRWQS